MNRSLNERNKRETHVQARELGRQWIRVEQCRNREMWKSPIVVRWFIIIIKHRSSSSPSVIQLQVLICTISKRSVKSKSPFKVKYFSKNLTPHILHIDQNDKVNVRFNTEIYFMSNDIISSYRYHHYQPSRFEARGVFWLQI